MTPFTITEIEGSPSGLGAIISDINVEQLSDSDFEALRVALYKYNLICIRGQDKLTPKQQADLNHRFDPDASGYGHGKTLGQAKSILHPDLKTCPKQPEVQIIGNGFIPEYEGLKNFQLKHPHHKTFHKTSIPDEQDLDYTRFYRWHIDAALFGKLNPPLVTSLLAVDLPEPRYQTLLYDESGSAQLKVPLGTTAFVSGYTMFDLLSEEDKKFVLESRLEYAPHPYVWISSAASRADGLGLISEGKELPLSSLPPFQESDIQILPMAWQNPITKKYALQIHPSVVRKIHRADGTVVDDLATVREIVHMLQRKAIAPELVYAHNWQKGDLVLFNNHGVLHSVVGAFAPEEVRLFRQCNLAASRPPMGPESATVSVGA